MLKQGQTINIGGRWGTVTYLLGDREAIVTLDDYSQVQAGLDELMVPPALLVHYQEISEQKLEEESE